MRRSTLAVMVIALVGLAAMTVYHMASTPHIGYAQGVCPWTVEDIGTNCVLLPPAQGDSITDRIQPDGSWALSFNSASSGCTTLYSHFLSARSKGNVYFAASLPEGAYGYYRGQGDGNGKILISNRAFADGGFELERTVIHEAAHDLGCSDIGNHAEQWGQFCAGDYEWGINSPPPPVPCDGMY
jgi:hypothetical protein